MCKLSAILIARGGSTKYLSIFEKKHIRNLKIIDLRERKLLPVDTYLRDESLCTDLKMRKQISPKIS